MQENKTIRKRIEVRQHGLGVACVLLAIAALTSCDEQASPSNTTSTPVVDDSAAAYAALSSALERCEDANEACLDRAGASTDARERCERDAAGCRAHAEPIEEQAEKTLERESHWCRKVCSDDDAGPGGTDDADGGTGDLDECIDKHAPRLPKCSRGLVTCLNDVGVFQRAATRTEIRDCVDEAHECISDRLKELRQWKRDRWHNRAGSDAQDAGAAIGGTGGATAGSAGSEAGSGGSAAGSGAAGSGGADAGVSPASEERRGRRHHHWKPFWKR